MLAERAGLRIHEVPVDWIDDPDSRVDILATALDDLRGIARLGRGLMRGRSRSPSCARGGRGARGHAASRLAARPVQRHRGGEHAGLPRPLHALHPSLAPRPRTLAACWSRPWPTRPRTGGSPSASSAARPGPAPGAGAALRPRPGADHGSLAVLHAPSGTGPRPRADRPRRRQSRGHGAPLPAVPFPSEFGGQISWLLPAVLICLVGMLWVRGGPSARTGPAPPALLWGGWLVCTGLVFSYMSGIIHPYYMARARPGDRRPGQRGRDGAVGAAAGDGSAGWRPR